MFEYQELRKQYESFNYPVAVIMVAGKDISKDKGGFSISDIFVELSCGFEASVAEFKIYNTYDVYKHEFRFEEMKKLIALGSSVKISMGYGTSARDVFRGFISQVNFVYRRDEPPAVEVHAMDIKGIMMANSYAKQLTAQSYSEAVKLLLDQPFYQKLKGDKGLFNDINITDTPDKQQGGNNNETTDKTIEMVNESDYEFVVRAAKRFNYEFFQSNDSILFRKAKSDDKELITIGPYDGMLTFEIGYDVTGLAGKVEVRNVDAAKGKVFSSKKKLESKMSEGNIAKQLVSKQTKVYIDPTAATQTDAEYRANYLMEQMSYRFGTLEADIVGLPEIIPGKFLKVDGLGKGASNRFYITSVTHSMEGQGIYQTHISGRAATLQ
ncbi:MAG: phage late control D family protein [Lachnospiraceae bacterium]|nr:phage late control D family protein [Lachnospiraceae bacterium]